MTTSRPTLRPVTLSRLIEVTDYCLNAPRTTVDVEHQFKLTRNRARETVLEAARIGLLTEGTPTTTSSDNHYVTTQRGTTLLKTVQAEEWAEVSRLLAAGSHHYRTYLRTIREAGPVLTDEVLKHLRQCEERENTRYNATAVDILNDWAERLQVVQRNTFTGAVYAPEHTTASEGFPAHLNEAYDSMNHETGVSLQRQYVPIPELREYTCQFARLSRDAFDDALATVAKRNVGTVELIGAPIDTEAKSAPYGIRKISTSDDDGLVTTTQSSERTMQPVILDGKKYYHLTIHDNDITY